MSDIYKGLKAKHRVNGILTHVALAKNKSGWLLEFKRFLSPDEDYDMFKSESCVITIRGNLRIMKTTLGISNESINAIIVMYNLLK